ncbi:MAG: methyltransferase [Planctomycetota bacterium]|jgi:release factor glutamine methyltransferase|nr:methyltransferase [Planctomycetota bacterium]MDP6937849.1 methyltransferase [Planctomycetota bacterium]
MGTPHPHDLLQMDLSGGDDDWSPTPHGQLLALALAENNLVCDKSVLELGAGVGNHTILLLRQSACSMVVTEITPERLETTRANVERNMGPPWPEPNIEYRAADWLNTEGCFDVLVTNPPYMVSGKQNRRYFIDSLILDAHKRLNPGGTLVFVQSSMADTAKSIRRLEENGYAVRTLATSRGPFRDYYFEDPTFIEEIQSVPDGFELKDGEYTETLTVLCAVLQPYSPPDVAH